MKRIIKKTGTSMTTEISPAKAKRIRRARARQERAWAAKAGPVVVRKIGEPKDDG